MKLNSGINAQGVKFILKHIAHPLRQPGDTVGSAYISAIRDLVWNGRYLSGCPREAVINQSKVENEKAEIYDRAGKHYAKQAHNRKFNHASAGLLASGYASAVPGPAR